MLSMKKDILIGAVVGILTGFFVLTIFFYLSINFQNKNLIILGGIPILWGGGVWLGYFLSRFVPFFKQFGKFATVGFLSASIDFAVLNLVSDATRVTAGTTVGLINIPGFLVAVTNGYLWNKLWVFPSASGEGSLFHDFPKFLTVTVLGLLINSGVIIILTTYISSPAAFDTKEWLNIAKVVASAIALIWNFIGYRFIVFAQKK